MDVSIGWLQTRPMSVKLWHNESALICGFVFSEASDRMDRIVYMLYSLSEMRKKIWNRK